MYAYNSIGQDANTKLYPSLPSSINENHVCSNKQCLSLPLLCLITQNNCGEGIVKSVEKPLVAEYTPPIKLLAVCECVSALCRTFFLLISNVFESQMSGGILLQS